MIFLTGGRGDCLEKRGLLGFWGKAKRFRLWRDKQVTEEGFDLKSKLETEQWI